MTGHELVSRAIEFRRPDRLPFCQEKLADFPNDVMACLETDRARRGWFFDSPGEDDWGCGWTRTQDTNMGQVTHHPLADWAAFDNYRPPDPRDDFYYERVGPALAEADGRYVLAGSHFNLIERHHMLRGFEQALTDYYVEPGRTHRLLDMILEFRLGQFEELRRRFGGRIHGVFLTDDWGTQEGPFVNDAVFREFFLERYRTLVASAHANGLHLILHSCGRINDLLPHFIDVGVDAMNMQQPQAYGIAEVGRIARGKIAFFATADIQATLPRGDPEAIRREVAGIVRHWGTPDGGLVAFDYGKDAALGTRPEASRIMFQAFIDAYETGG